MSLESKLAGTGSTASTLEGRIYDEPAGFGSALKKISFWEWAKIAGITAASAALSGGLFGYGALNVLTTTASFISANYLLSRKKGFTKKSVQTDLNLGGPYTYLTYKLFEILNIFANPLLWSGAYALLMYPFTVATNGLKYLIEKYSPLSYVKGIFKGEAIRDVKHIAKDAVTDSANSSAKAALWLTLPVALSHYLLPQELLIASLYPIRTAYRYIIGMEPSRAMNFAPSMSYAT